MTRLRFNALHEAFHVVAGRTQRIHALYAKVSSTCEPIKSPQHRDATGITVFPYSRARMIRLGGRAAVTYLAGAVGSQFVEDPEWCDASRSDHEVVMDALKYSAEPYEELLAITNKIVREWYGLASRLADFLEAYGEIRARKINEIYAYNR